MHYLETTAGWYLKRDQIFWSRAAVEGWDFADRNQRVWGYAR